MEKEKDLFHLKNCSGLTLFKPPFQSLMPKIQAQNFLKTALLTKVIPKEDEKKVDQNF